MANLSEQCIKSPIICPTDDNCTSSVCYLEGNSSVGYHPGGCENQTLDCDYSYAIIGIIEVFLKFKLKYSFLFRFFVLCMYFDSLY